MKTEKQYLTPEQVRTKIVEDYSYSYADISSSMISVTLGALTEVAGYLLRSPIAKTAGALGIGWSIYTAGEVAVASMAAEAMKKAVLDADNCGSLIEVELTYLKLTDRIGNVDGYDVTHTWKALC